MPVWTEDWTECFLLYAICVPVAFISGAGGWAVPLLVASCAWFIAASSSISAAREGGALAPGVLGVLLQSAVLALVVFWAASKANSSWLGVAAMCLLASIAVVGVVERKRTGAIQYNLEALVVCCFSAGFLALNLTSTTSTLVNLLVVHFAVLTLALLRNSRVVLQSPEGLVISGGCAHQVWHAVRRSEGVGAGLLRALSLPSGVLGAMFVAAEAILLALL